MATGDVYSTIVWFLMFFVFIFIYPRMMLSQLIYQLETSAKKMEEMSVKANLMCAKKAGKKKGVKEKIDEFTDFFVVEPSAIDPYGLVKKVDHTIRNMEHRFTEFVEEAAPELSAKEKDELNYGLRAAIGLRQLSKMVRHYVELSKKFKNLQIAMILKMQMPIIEKIAEGELKGTEAFVSGLPIGDSIGPMAAATLMEKPKAIAEDVVMDTVTIHNKTCYVLKATGPSPHLGRMDEAISKILKKNRIAKVITIDAAAKLEGEKSGTVSEGIGFAMGGMGQREMIENILVPKKIPIDSVVVKVGITEAIEPMKKEIMDAVPKVIEKVNASVKRAESKKKLIIIGVGNSCGIGNDKKSLESVRATVIKLDKIRKEEDKKKKKGRWI